MAKRKPISVEYYIAKHWCSPVCEELVRVVKHDEKGNEYIVWEPMDVADYQKSLGPVDYWSLDTLLKAGINPDFGIHTGYQTRLEGIADIETMTSVADSLLADLNNNEEKTN